MFRIRLAMKSEAADVIKLDKEYKLFIGGKWVSASDGKTFTTVCSATGEKLAECAEATKEDVDAAVKAAEEAFPAWAAVMTAEAYTKFRDSLGLKPLSDYGITKEQGLAVAHDVSVECFAPLTPVKVTEEAATKMLGEIFQ